MADEMEWYDILAIALLIVGGINWFLVGFFSLNLIQFLYGVPFLPMIVYGLEGAAAVFSVLRFTVWK